MANLRKIFSKIYDRYVDKIYRFIFFKVNSQEISEDLASETFLRTWEVFKKGEEIKNVQAFLYKTARNLVTDYYRQKARTEVISAEDRPIIDPREDLEEKAMLSSDLETIRMALTKLPEEYQYVIIWYYLDDFPIREVAKMLDRTEATTRVLLHRALKALKNELNQSV